MERQAADFSASRKARETAVGRLLEAIGYPEKAPAGALSFKMNVDDCEIDAVEAGGRLRLELRIDCGDDRLPALAEYAAGRMLREEAVLAWDGKGGRALLWQDAPAASDARTLRRLFETFSGSCDWWRARAEEPPAEPEPQLHEVTIRP